MSKINMYRDLVKCKILNAVNVENTKVFENDIVIDDENANRYKRYKIETDNMTHEEILIALEAKQTLVLNTIKNILSFFMVITILSVLMMIMIVI